MSGRADAFVRPFDYQVPAGSGIRLYPKSDHLHVCRHRPATCEASRSGRSRMSWRTDALGSRTALARRQRQPGVEGLLSYIRSVRSDCTSRTSGASSSTAGRRYRVDLTVEEGDARCPMPEAEPLALARHIALGGRTGLMQIPGSGHVPLTVVDVDGETIAIEVWSGGDVDEWLPTADAIIDSIRFLYRPPASRPRRARRQSP